MNEISKGILKIADEKAKNLAKKAKDIGKTVISTGIEKVEKGYDHINETLKKKKLTDKIIEDAKNNYAKAEARAEFAREMLTVSGEKLNELENNIINGEFLRFGALYSLFIGKSLCFHKDSDNMDMIYKKIDIAFEEHIPPSIKGIIAGSGAVGLVVGLTFLFGTASTGTLISTLSGSAAVSATLAALGGGSLAAGGFGIVGGIMTLGGIFVFPAIGVGAFFWSKDINENYEKALEFERKVKDAVSELNAYENSFMRGLNFVKQSENSLIIGKITLSKMLDVFERSLTLGDTEEAAEIAKKTVAILGEIMALDYSFKDEWEHKKSFDKLQNLMINLSFVEEEFGAYIERMNEYEREETRKYFEIFFKIHNENKKLSRVVNIDEVQILIEKTFEQFAKNEIYITYSLIKEFLPDNISDKILEEILKKGLTLNIIADNKKTIAELKEKYRNFGNSFNVKYQENVFEIMVVDKKFYFISPSLKLREKLKIWCGYYSENTSMLKFYIEKYFKNL